MTSLCELVTKWENTDVSADGLEYLSDAGVTFGICAAELEATLPVWTRITGDESSWPEDGQIVMFADFDHDGTCQRDFQHWIGKWWSRTWWRPLCSIDTPNE